MIGFLARQNPTAGSLALDQQIIDTFVGALHTLVQMARVERTDVSPTRDRGEVFPGLPACPTCMAKGAYEI
jgi:hypothetical protein